MEQRAVALMRNRGLAVRKIHRRPRRYLSKIYGVLAIERYAVRVNGKYFHPLDFLICPGLYGNRRRGILPSLEFCEQLLRIVPGSLSFNAGAGLTRGYPPRPSGSYSSWWGPR